MKNTITQEHIEKIMSETQCNVMTMFDKVTVVVAQLPNGFVITESSGCVDKANYDEEIGAQICIKKIVDKVWELEGYRLQCELANKEVEEKESI